MAIAPESRVQNGQEVYDPLLEPTHKQLAKLHYGLISEARIGSEGWGNEVPR